MSEPVLQLNQAGHWDLIYSEIKYADELPGNRFRPIPPFTIPILFQSPWLAIGSNSAVARSHWWLGCRVQPVIVVPDSPFDFIDAPPHQVPLNAFTLFKFPALEQQYRLRVSVPWWHRELGITVYEYTGPASDTTEDLIVERTDVIRVDLARVEAKVDAL